MFTYMQKNVYFNSFSLANEDKFITSKDFDTLNTRFTLKEPKQTCISSVFIGPTKKGQLENLLKMCIAGRRCLTYGRVLP